MKGRGYLAEQIVAKPREAEVLLGRGIALGEVCRQLEITDVTYYRGKKEYGELWVDQAKRLEEGLLELETTLTTGYDWNNPADIDNLPTVYGSMARNDRLTLSYEQDSDKHPANAQYRQRWQQRCKDW